MSATLDHELIEQAHQAYRDEYRKNFPAGGDAGDDAEACRCGVEAVLLLALKGQAVVIPDDGKEHACPCGSSGYRVWDGDGWLRKGEYRVTDDEGRSVSYCHGCDRELEPGASGQTGEPDA